MSKPTAFTKARRRKKDKRGKWSRQPWIRILELLAEMPKEERDRCVRATAEFVEGWE